MFRVKRAYEPASAQDGRRVLVDRLWPRGVSKARAALDEWVKDIAPSDELRHWFGHDPAKWDEFQKRYREELAHHEETLERLARMGAGHRVTLVFAAHDEAHNNAVVVRDVLREINARTTPPPRRPPAETHRPHR